MTRAVRVCEGTSDAVARDGDSDCARNFAAKVELLPPGSPSPEQPVAEGRRGTVAQRGSHGQLDDCRVAPWAAVARMQPAKNIFVGHVHCFQSDVATRSCGGSLLACVRPLESRVKLGG